MITHKQYGFLRAITAATDPIIKIEMGSALLDGRHLCSPQQILALRILGLVQKTGVSEFMLSDFGRTAANRKDIAHMTLDEYLQDVRRVREDIGGIQNGYVARYAYQNQHSVGPHEGIIVTAIPQFAVGDYFRAPYGQAVVAHVSPCKQALSNRDLYEAGRALHKRCVFDALQRSEVVPDHILATYNFLQVEEDDREDDTEHETCSM